MYSMYSCITADSREGKAYWPDGAAQRAGKRSEQLNMIPEHAIY